MILKLSDLITKYNLDIKGVIHIGAHHGSEHKLYKEQMINNLMYFEPIKNNFEVLKSVVGDEGVLYNMALGSSKGEFKMFTEDSNKGMSCSLLKPKTHIHQYPGIVFNSEEIVQVEKLDNIPFDRNDYNFLNIDVQGFELEVFKGGIDTLLSIDCINAEVNRAELYENCPMVDELDTFLKSFGFDRVETDWMGGTWGDAFYIKNK